MGAGGKAVSRKISKFFMGAAEDIIAPAVDPAKAVIKASGQVFTKEAPAPPTDEELSDAAKRKERQLQRLRQGRKSTILSDLRAQFSPEKQGSKTKLS